MTRCSVMVPLRANWSPGKNLNEMIKIKLLVYRVLKISLK